MVDEDDRLDFLEEEVDDPTAGLPVPDPWRVLVVDDDEDVHQATSFALRGARILGRPLEFLHAYSSASALEILREATDLAVILLDVVMETEDAGLALIGRVREELGLLSVRIILRTGQPGYAPDIEAITRYDINDYKTKAELNRSRLFTVLTAAIRSYDQITRLDEGRRGLELIVDGTNRFIAEQGMPTFATGVIHQIAALLAVPPVGVAVRQAGDAKAPLAVLASTGSFAEGQAVPSAARIAAECCLVAALREKKLQEDAGGIALYFSGKDGQDFAAYVEKPPGHQINRYLLDVFCANVAICADNIGLVARLRETAYVDALTGLPNRTALIEIMEGRLAKIDGHARVVAIVDIDQFSETIDILGYRYGDQILVEVARRLRGALPDDVCVARVGGDVFGLVGAEDVVNPALLREILNDPLMIEEGTQTVSISLGFVIADDTTSGADLLRYAAIALKRAKADGVGREAYYTPEVAIQTRERVRMLQDLRAAFSSDRLFVVYQPQVDLASARAIGVEALLRWRTDDGRFIPPDRFIPVAEQSGLIVALGAWVLRTSLHALNNFRAAGHQLRMAVNVSAIQFHHPGFMEMLDQALAETGAPPELLELEITESVAMFGQAEFEGRIHALKSRGLTVAIDDFGTGFSSLSYLDRLSADCLKIDRSFVWALDSNKPGARIAEMVVALGRRLGMRVLAEGVETAEQAGLLRQMGCDQAQGWLYGRPVVQEELMLFLAGQRS
ncbi:MAG: putative bifunctional diguanylate cyclase/phosphodiesterase [Betaproteobacteria bacterium]